ncbi:hypothetical protein ABW19_dt0204168 [Dactylella cylindrospora]|nr:hypothetical protein ABW19_dt0204168 [Dactylella cylindrospora]
MDSTYGIILSAIKDHWGLLGIGIIASYLLLVRYLRYQRLHNLIRNINHDCGAITKSSEVPIYHAEAIAKHIGSYEFPLIMRLSLQFALFRTYGIPSISSLLWKTRQFTQRSTAHRRYADTSILIIEMMSSPLDSPRSKLALERINYLHNRHKDSISNNDLLYTLSLFMCQPAVFIDRFEWRKLHPIEKLGMHRFWSEVGIRMGIQGIPDSFEATYAWANEYEEKYMVPAEINASVAISTVEILMYFIPTPLRPATLQIIRAVCDPRLRAAFLWPDPPPSAKAFVKILFTTRAFIIQHLCLPRLSSIQRCSKEAIDESVPLLERRYRYFLWETDPWYIEKTWWNTWGPTGLICRIMGWRVPSTELHQSGYRIGELGPMLVEGKGVGNLGYQHGSLYGGGSIVGQGEKGYHTKMMEGGSRCPMLPG